MTNTASTVVDEKAAAQALLMLDLQFNQTLRLLTLAGAPQESLMALGLAGLHIANAASAFIESVSTVPQAA